MATTITVTEDTLERFKAQKAKLDEQQDAPDHTNDSFLQALLDTWEAADDGYYSNPSADAIAEELSGRGITLDASERQKIAQEVAEVLHP